MATTFKDPSRLLNSLGVFGAGGVGERNVGRVGPSTLGVHVSLARNVSGASA